MISELICGLWVALPTSSCTALSKKTYDIYVVANFDLLVLPGGVKSLEKLRQEKSVLGLIYTVTLLKMLIIK